MEEVPTRKRAVYRRRFAMLDELDAMNPAYRLRAPGQNGVRFNAWGSFLGQLLLRSMDRAQELYSSMLLRGYEGEFRYAKTASFGLTDAAYTIFIAGLCILFRYVNLAEALGRLFVR